MKKKVFAILVCILTIPKLCYAASNVNDIMSKSERQAISTFFIKMQTCQNAQVNGQIISLKAYKSGNYCIYEETNIRKQKSMKCQFPRNITSIYAKNGFEINSSILNNTDPNPQTLIENIGLAKKYCKY